MSGILREATIHSPQLNQIAPDGITVLYRPDKPYVDASVSGEATCMSGGHKINDKELVYFLDEPLIGPGFTGDTRMICHDHLTLRIPTLTSVKARVFLDDPEATVTPEEA